MSAHLRPIFVALVVVAWPAIVAAQTPRQLFVAVTDASGAPVLDMKPSEFDVREGAVPRKVTLMAISAPSRDQERRNAARQ